MESGSSSASSRSARDDSWPPTKCATRTRPPRRTTNGAMPTTLEPRDATVTHGSNVSPNSRIHAATQLAG